MDTDQYDVKCPVCCGEWNHIEQVRVLFGKDDYTTCQATDITANSLSVKPCKTQLDYRLNGMSVILYLLCENGHFWEREFYTHKGVYHEADRKKEG